MRRFHASLSSFFTRTVRERMVAFNPVTNARQAQGSSPRAEMYTFSEQELERIYARGTEQAPGRELHEREPRPPGFFPGETGFGVWWS